MRRINFYGGPCCGKSSTAAWLFHRLKVMGYEVELVNEWVKAWAWLDIRPSGYDQIYIFAKQLRKEDIVLRSSKSIIISDSPLWMQLAYIRKYQDHALYDPIESLYKVFENRYPSVNIGLFRETTYQKHGRFETEDQAKEIDNYLDSVVAEQNLIDKKCSPNDLEEIAAYAVLAIKAYLPMRL